MEAVSLKIRLKYLLDTHTFLWAAYHEDRLGTKAARILAITPYEQLAIADISLQEIGLLVDADRIGFSEKPERGVRELLEFVTVLPITLEIGLLAPSLPLPHGDQFDRIITATAKTHKLTLITKDATITDSGIVSTLW